MPKFTCKEKILEAKHGLSVKGSARILAFQLQRVINSYIIGGVFTNCENKGMEGQS